MTDRLVRVPEGLDGERVDSALARMFGFSRTGAVRGTATPSKSDFQAVAVARLWPRRSRR